MIVTQLVGGLGNQIFQHAAAQKIAAASGMPVVYDLYQLKVHQNPPRRLVMDKFKLPCRLADWTHIWRMCPQEVVRRLVHHRLPKRFGSRVESVLERASFSSPCRYRLFDQKPGRPAPSLKIGKVVSERQFHFDPDFMSLSSELLLMGYWQTEKYFVGIRDTLLAELKVNSQQAGQDLAVAGRMRASQSVSLHVRRGDKAVAKDFNGTTAEFCQRAVAWFRERVSNPVFFVFTDDWAWVREHLPSGKDVVYVDHNDGLHDYEDLRLMTQCRHHIIAPSSFSWWGAWLNPDPDKMVVSPPHRRWLNFANCDTADVIPESWVQLDDR